MRYFTAVATALLLAGASFAATAGADTITVGADSSCDYSSLDRAIDAIAAGARKHRIHVARNIVQVLTDPDRIPRNVQLIGGYSNCSDETALGYTAVSVQYSPSADLVASANRVRFEMNERVRIALTPSDARRPVQPVHATRPVRRATQ